MPTDKHEGLPRYPALARCVLIDARFSSRLAISKDIKATLLFEEVLEATSIPHGLELLAEVSADVCVLGPSLSSDKACEFLSAARESSCAEDCAFIAIVEHAEEVPRLNGAHAHKVLTKPLSKHQLFDGMVEAVVRANENSPWRAIFAATGGKLSPLPPAPIIGRFPQLDAVAVSVLSDTSGFLPEVVSGIERGQFALDISGNPTRQSELAIAAHVEQLLGEDAELDDLTQEFKAYLADALLVWLVDVHSMEEKAATRKLRARLGRFSPKSA
jgi:hypothetical protein